jgi:signal transduction histidine kinase
VADVVREVAQTFAQDARYRGVVEVAWSCASAPAWVDPDRLRQALWNLILNGAQAMPGGGRISLATTDRVGDGHGAVGVEVVVCDDGVGIPLEDRSRVFDPLFTRRAGGTGLGLAVVDHVVRAHGGRIELECPEEGGTMFRMWLPKEVEGAR